jgi:SRSO17 transposase
MVLPAIERHGAIEAWIIDDTGFPKKMLWGRRRDSCKIVASINGH